MTHNFCDATIKKSGIYKITRPNGVVVYVGSAFSFIKRFHCHRSQLRGGYHHSIVLQRIYKKHGDEHLTMGLLDVCDIEDLPKREVKYIADIRPIANSSKEYKASMLGRKHNEITKLKISNSNKGKHNKPCKPDSREKISNTLTGVSKSASHIENISKAKRGSRNPMHGKTPVNVRGCKSIDMNGNSMEYQSLKEAQETTGVDFRNIQAVCAGRRKKSGGFTFMYI
jgi:group I intron endonuclease